MATTITAKLRIISWILLFLLIFPAVARASSKPRLIFQKTFGASSAILKYSEYEYDENIVSVIQSAPRFFNYSVAFANPPKSVSQFHHDNKNALLTLNGGYWDDLYRPTDLCVVEGKIIKSVNTRNSHFGLFAIRRNGELVIDDLKNKPLNKADVSEFLYALKSGPHLIRKGAPVAYKSSRRHARTVVGKNVQNNVLFVITKSGMMSYAEMSEFLLDLGLGITEAFNLDGGSSTGFALGRGTNGISRDTVNIANVIQVMIKMQK